MFIRKINNKKTGKTYLSIVQSYYDKTTHSTKSVTIKSLGCLDELKKTYSDPIAHFSEVVAKMNEEKDAENLPPKLTINTKKQLENNSINRKNFGYAVLSKIYHELELDKFFINRQRHLNIKYSLNNIVKLLVFSRILNPSSKKKTFENKDNFFEKFDFSLDDVYRSLPVINKHKNELQSWLHHHIKQQYNRSTELVYYDVTNYYFEIDKPDNLRKKGVSKEHRPNPLVQMGLLMDSVGMPIAYKLFSGNTSDKTTLIPILDQLKNSYDLGRIIVVADRGLNTSDNICHNLLNGNGYVYSQTIRGANKEFKDYVLNDDDYVWIGGNYKKKSRHYPREITITNIHGKKTKYRIDEKQVVFYSRDYDNRAKKEREPIIQKALELINNPSKFNKATSFGAAKYVKDLVFDTTTGEILTVGHKPKLDIDKLREDEKFDGYYAIVTSEYKESDERIIEIYRGLWRIEESFRITKGDLSARPVYLSREEHIEAHFLTCFLALTILRILGHRIENKYSPAKVIECLNNSSCAYVQENLYMFDFYNDILHYIGQTFDIDFSKKFMCLNNIKKILGNTKKDNFTP